MKKTLYSVLLAMGALAAQAQTADTVRLGASYVNQAWYSLDKGIVGTTQSKDNWDLAFEITGYSASILANTQKANFALYKAPFKALAYGSVDTAGIATWPTLYNSDKSWSVGAFSGTANPNNEFDLGWGVYDLNTHYVTGDSCYVIKVAANVYKKLLIENLANGAYNFTYGGLDGNSDTSITIAKTDYAGKNFAYYSILDKKALNREPASAAWDLTFVKYTTFLDAGNGTTIPYGVTGILQNAGVKAAQVDNVTSVASFFDTTGQVFKSDINEIGYDWKTYDFASTSYKITEKQLFFVKDKAGKYWKLVFTGFASTNGQFSFTKEALSFTTGLEDEAGVALNRFAVYPNPSADETVNLLFDSRTATNVQISISDAQGTLLHHQEVNMEGRFHNQELAVGHLKSGIYFVTVNAGGKNHIQKFVKQ